jgi:hypothetical protein
MGRALDEHAAAHLSPVLNAIFSQEDAGNRWELAGDEVRELLGIDQAEFYRRVYTADRQRHPLVGLDTATGTFNQDNIGEFLSLLELFVGREAEDVLQNAGLFFNHSEQFEILSTFLGIVSTHTDAHELEPRTFRGMLEVLGSYEEARRTYIDEFFSVSRMIDEAVDRYTRHRAFSRAWLAARNARGLLHSFFSRHVLEVETVLAQVCADLFEVAYRAGYVSRPEDEYAEYRQAWGSSYASADGRNGAGGDARTGRTGRNGSHGDRYRQSGAEERDGFGTLRWAQRVMGVGYAELDKESLKARYKQLMKEYHPDVNPRGLIRCQEVNAAYSLLLSRI